MTRSTKIAVWAGGIVLFGIVVLVGYAISRPMHGKWYAHESAREHIYVLSDVLEQYHAEHGHYPSTDHGLEPRMSRIGKAPNKAKAGGAREVGSGIGAAHARRSLAGALGGLREVIVQADS